MTFIPEGAIKPSSIERQTYEAQMDALRTIVLPNNQQMRIDYDSDGNPEYVGITASGVASSGTGWIISKYTWSSGNCTLKQIAEGIWDNRASLSYA